MFGVFVAMLAIFFVLGTAIAIASRRLLREGFTEFVVGGYRVGGFLSAMTYAATTYSAFMMVGLVGLTYATGIAALGFELVYLAATIGILSTVGITVWRRSRERKWVSPSEMLGDLYGLRTLASALSTLYLIVLTPYLAAQFKGVGEIFGAIGLGYEAGVVFAAIAIFAWIALAGLWSIATTDAFQGLWMISASIAITVWAIAFLLPSAGLSISKAFELISGSNRDLLGFNWTTSMFVGLSIPWVFFALTNPQVVQRLYIPKDGYAYRRMVKYFAVYGLLYTLICVFLGLLFRSYAAAVSPELELQLAKARDSVTPAILMRGHVLMSAAGFVGIIAAAISTANSIVLTVASSVARDLYMIYARRCGEERVVAMTYVAAGVMTAIAATIALQRIAYIVELSVTSSAFLLPLAPITVAGIYLEPKRRGAPYAVASLTAGLLVMAIAVVLYGPSKALTAPALLGLPAPLWCLATSATPMAILALVKARASRA